MSFVDSMPYWLLLSLGSVPSALMLAWVTLESAKHCESITVPWLRSYALSRDVWPLLFALASAVGMFGVLALRG